MTILSIIMLVWAAWAVRLVPASKVVVVDGDSLRIGGIPCRIIGIDAPEWSQPQGPASDRALRGMLAGRRLLVLRGGRDAYGRRLVRIWTAGSAASISFRMVSGGHAFADGLMRLPVQIMARIAKRGMWDGRGKLVHPDVWRRLNAPPMRARIVRVAIPAPGRTMLGRQGSNLARAISRATRPAGR